MKHNDFFMRYTSSLFMANTYNMHDFVNPDIVISTDCG